MESTLKPGCSLLKATSTEDTDDQVIADDNSDFLSILKKKGSGNSADRETFKNYAIALYYNSPKTYKLLMNHFNLPTKAEIDNALYRFSLVKILKHLKKEIANPLAINGICALLIKKINLKPQLFYDRSNGKVVGFCDLKDEKYVLADGAIVMMLKGLTADWKQVIGYYLISSSQSQNDFDVCLRENINTITKDGFQVVALVTDTELAHIVTPFVLFAETDHFKNEGQQISIVIDVCDTLQKIGSDFQKTEVTFTKTTSARWRHVKQLYEMDEMDIKFAPKLTDAHLRLNDNKDYSFFADIFSHTVGTALLYNCKIGTLPGSADGTAKFLMVIGQAFAELNSEKPFYNTLNDVLIFNACLDLIQEINNDTNNYFQYLKTTIKSVMKISERLKIHNIKKMQLRRLSMEPLNNFMIDLEKATKMPKNNINIVNFINSYGCSVFRSLLEKSYRDDEELMAFMNYSEKLTRITSMNVIVHQQFESFCLKWEDEYKKLSHNPLLFISACVYKTYVAAKLCAHADDKLSYSESDGLPTSFLTYMINLDSKFTRYFKASLKQEDGAGIVEALLSKLMPVMPLQAECCSLYPKELIVKTFIQVVVIKMLSSQSGVIKLAEIIGEHPVIYNHTLSEHGKKYIMEKAWESVVDKVNEISDEKFTVTDLKTRWKGIRSSYTRYLAKKHQEISYREYYLSDTLKFLEPFVKPTKFIFPRKSDSASEDQSESQLEASQMSESEEEYDKYFYVDVGASANRAETDTLDIKPTFCNEEFQHYDQATPSKKRAKLDKDENNVDLDFFKSILPDIKHFSAKEKRKFKIGILKLIDDIDDNKRSD